MSAARQEFPPKYYDSVVGADFDFLANLASGEVILTATVTIAVWSGTDSAPTFMLNGSPSIASSIVTQSLRNGHNGVVYVLTCLAVTSLSNTLVKTGYLAVIDHTS